MSFGYIPNPNLSTIKRLVLKAVGYPVVTRRIEVAYLLRLLNLSPTDKVLDAGCGDGILTAEFGKRCGDIVGIDISDDNLNTAKRNAERCGLSNAVFVKGDLQKLPFVDESFDKIYSNSVLQHIEKEGRALAEFSRVLKPGGTIVMTVPSDRTNVGESCLSPIPLLFRLPKPLRKVIGTKTLNKSKDVQDFQRRQLYTNWKQVKKGYSSDTLVDKLKHQGFENIYTEYYLKTFGGLAQDLRCAVKGCNNFFSFFLLYPLSQLDKLTPRNAGGYFFVIKALKGNR